MIYNILPQSGIMTKIGNNCISSDIISETPTIPKQAVKNILNKVRKSSQERISMTNMIVMRILMIDSLIFRETDRLKIEETIGKIVSEHLDTFSQQCRRQCQSSDEQNELKHKLELEKITTANKMLRKAILDYVSDGDLEKLTRKVFE